jgi:hypothetical protein
MLIQEKLSGPDTLLKLPVAIDDDLKALEFQVQQISPKRGPQQSPS